MQTEAERLTRARELASYETAEEFAAVMGLNPHTYRNYETGRRPIPRHLVPKLADKLSVSPAWIVTGESGDFFATLPAEDQRDALEAARVTLGIPKAMRSLWFRQGQVLMPPEPDPSNETNNKAPE